MNAVFGFIGVAIAGLAIIVAFVQWPKSRLRQVSQMRYRLRTLLIWAAFGPPLIALFVFWCRLPTTAQIRSIAPGMSQAEVVAIAGKPQERSKSYSGGEYWGYWRDISDVFGPEMVEFDKSGHVVGTWSH
jgi:hypothetical protein